MKLGNWREINAAHVQQLSMVPVGEVINFETYQDIQVTKVELTESADVAFCLFPRGACSGTVQNTAEANGNVYAVSLECQIPRPTPEVMAWLQGVGDVRWLVWWVDFNGDAYLAGDPDNGLRLAWTRSQAGVNAISLSLTGRGFHAPYYMAEGEPIFTEFTTEFSFDFNS